MAQNPADSLYYFEDNPKNLPCNDFFDHWARMASRNLPHYPPIRYLTLTPERVRRPEKIAAYRTNAHSSNPPLGKMPLHSGPKNAINPAVQHSGEFDIQGIPWSLFQTTQTQAREVRRMTYRNHRNLESPTPQIVFGTPGFKARLPGKKVPNSDTYFQFREMNTKHKPSFSHFQLRNNIASCGASGLLYYHQLPADDRFASESNSLIMYYNPQAEEVRSFMDFTKLATGNKPRLDRVSTLATGCGVAIAGSLACVYALKALHSKPDSVPTTGIVTDDQTCSTNHIHIARSRSGGTPQAIICSNDNTIRTLDCRTQQFTSIHAFGFPVNCSATDPNRRLRLLVGDDEDKRALLADAETGEVIANLHGHTDFGFACAFADDGITMATGHQDGLVQVWDARNCSQSIHKISMELGGCRAMQFSPIGSGKRVLVLAEPADFVHVVDAQRYESKQTIEFFGEIAGITMPREGEKLWIANWDPHYGGLMEFDRCWNTSGYATPPEVHEGSREISLMESMLDTEDQLDGVTPDTSRSPYDLSRTHSDERKAGFRLDIAKGFDWLPGHPPFTRRANAEGGGRTVSSSTHAASQAPDETFWRYSQRGLARRGLGLGDIIL